MNLLSARRALIASWAENDFEAANIASSNDLAAAEKMALRELRMTD